ncbi:MbnP family protein [Capnocytophaga gingivalis]|jgi:hypothetical protein|uniref:MbnP family protein n=1 Tax=Capnocytophaga gingivalis TaxID=1017 RepID=UPI002B4A642E|nr:MbnP family protein [Capnocytophaga gingivalis]MEB3012952.1 MbnP family protein [Capnocytophaga gingivalis]
MRNFRTLVIATTAIAALSSCSKDNNTPQPGKPNPGQEEKPTPGLQGNGKVSLQFENYVGEEKLTLGADANTAKAYTSNGQTLKFSEVKYVITNIVLVKADGTKVPYHTEDLDKGGFLINQENTTSLTPILTELPEGDYKGIEFGLGVKKELNNLKLQDKFPNFYNLTGKFSFESGKIMHWEWANGYRFVKLEGWYSNATATNDTLSIHMGSAFKGTKVVGEDKKVKEIKDEYLNVDRDAFRFISLDFPKTLSVKKGVTAKVTIKADLDKLVNGTNKITLEGKVPIVHSLNNMFPFLNNIGGNQGLDGKKIITITSPAKGNPNPTQPQDNLDNSKLDKVGMFSVTNVE